MRPSHNKIVVPYGPLQPSYAIGRLEKHMFLTILIMKACTREVIM